MRHPYNQDGLLDNDVSHPGPRAEFRIHMAVLFLVLAGGVFALIGGVLQNGEEIVAAFPTPSALLSADAWMKALSGVGGLCVVGLAVVTVVLFWRWRVGRARRRAASEPRVCTKP